jgi:hypothetical protein
VTARPYRRARRAFWTLVVVAVLLTGALGRLLQAPPSPRTGLAVAALGVLIVIVVGLATRLLLALTGRLPHRRETKPTAGRIERNA